MTDRQMYFSTGNIRLTAGLCGVCRAVCECTGLCVGVQGYDCVAGKQGMFVAWNIVLNSTEINHKQLQTGHEIQNVDMSVITF